MAFLATFYNNLNYKIGETKKYHAELDQEISMIQRDLVKLRTQEKITPSPLPSLLDQLKQNDQNLIHILQIFSKMLPSKAWITQLSQKENRFMVHGIALNNETISSFLTGLQTSNLFSNIKLVKAEQLTKKERYLKKFSIACDVEKI